MRKEWLAALTQEARVNKNIWLLVGDVGYGLVEPFRDEFPDRFINCGIAEQNMVGVAAGLALSGKTVFVYSLSNFVTFRCLEQIRNDICYHNANVKIVCSGGGLSYGNLGMTHHAIQDIAIMRCLPNMTVEIPCDGVSAALATKALIKRSGPAYLRLERDGEPAVYDRSFAWRVGKATQLQLGSDVSFLAVGGLVNVALEASEVLGNAGIYARVLDMHTIKPIDILAIDKARYDTGGIITIEEHSVIGGLGSAVAETHSGNKPFKRLGLNDCFVSEVGDQEYLRKQYGLSVDGIVKAAKELIGAEG